MKIEITKDNSGNLLIGKSESPVGYTKGRLYEVWVFDNEQEALARWYELCRNRAAEVKKEKFEGIEKIIKIFEGG